jgi:hypothetical protein
LNEVVVYDWMPIDSPTFGRIYRPIVLVEVRSRSGEWKSFYLEVDSGAPISVLNKSDCVFLGYRLDEGTPFALKGVLGGSTQSYIHQIELKIGNENVIARIAFTDGKNHKQLLGRIDVFNKFRICFTDKGSKTSFLKE